MSGTSQRNHTSTELVLGGGGIKGYAHIGVLRAIEERRIKIGKVTGVSIGSVVATLYKNGFDSETILEIMQREFAYFNEKHFGTAGSQNGVETEVAERPRSWLSMLGKIDLVEFFSELTKKYELTNRRNLRIVAYDALSQRPVLFDGYKYDLPTAIAASCAVPFVMKPVYLGEDSGKDSGKDQSLARTILDRLKGVARRTVLVDGGVFDSAPADFCEGIAIVSRLGVASQMPDREMSAAEYIFQSIEVSASRFMNRYLSRYKDHCVIQSGKPDVGALTFSLTRDDALALVEYGYRQAGISLDRALSEKQLPVRAGRK